MAEVAVTGGYNRGQEGYAVIGIETTAIAPDTATLPAVPTLALMGYANVPSAQRTNGSAKVFAAGSPYPLATKKGRRENNLSGTMTLGDGAGPVKLLQAAIRSNTVLTTAVRSLCLPYISIGRGAVGACDATRSKASLYRYGLVNTLGLSVTPDGGAMLNYGVVALTGQTSTALTTSTVYHAAIATAGGAPYSWDHLSVTIGGLEWRAYIASVDLQINNSVTPRLMRAQQTGGETNPLTRAPRDIMPGNEDNTLSITLAAPFPSTLVDFSTITIALDNGVHSHTWTLSTNENNELTESAVDNGGDFAYTVGILAGGLTYVYA